jgi:hypothetical protein
MENRRHIIYVDAGSTNSENYKIGLYDSQTNATHIMELAEIENNSMAEKYGLFYAIFYIYKNNYDNCMVLCDNQSAVNDKIINALAKACSIKISWIPREINRIADKTCKLEATLKESDFFSLDFFVKLSSKAYASTSSDAILKQEISQLKQEINNLKVKIKNQATQLTNMKKLKVKS